MQQPPIEGHVGVIDVLIWAAVAVGFLIMHWRVSQTENTLTDILNGIPLLNRNRKEIVEHEPADDANG